MRLDHVAYRVKDRHKTVKFFQDAFGYKTQTEFEIKFEDGSTAKCFALEPPEKKGEHPWTVDNVLPWHLASNVFPPWGNGLDYETVQQEYHMPPEIFISDGTPDSVVGKWVEKRDGVGGIHHLAYQVDSVETIMAQWKAKGYAEFTTEKPLTCPELTQVFTKPSELTGVIYEFITRGKHGFCVENVKDLMSSTAGL